MSTVEKVPVSNEEEKESDNVPEEDDSAEEIEVPQKDIIRYSLSTLLSLRSSKLSQAKPACRSLDLSCMASHKPPPKMLIANMMPKFALNQMQNRGEESISPVSFHSNSSSSSNLSYQKRFQDGGREPEGGYSNNRFYYNKYKYDDNSGGASNRIIYKTTGANTNNGNNIRFLKKAYNNKYDNQESSMGLISNKNILENSNRVITSVDLRNRKIVDLSDGDKKTLEKTEKDNEEKVSTDETNNNEKALKEQKDGTKVTEVNANELKLRNSGQNDLKTLPDDITNHLDDMFNNLNMNQLLPDEISDERESSRFSKWFNVNKDDLKDDKAPDLQNNNDSSGISSFPQSVESEKYFQPIDKVESNNLFQLLKGQSESQKENNSLMHMIQNQKQQQQQKSPSSGQVHSVEELEARLRHKISDEQNERKNNESEQKLLQNFFQQQLMPNLIHQQQQHPISQNQEDVNAFKKLLSQMANEDNKMQSVMNPSGSNLLKQIMTKPFPQHGSEMMMQQQQQQKGFSMGGNLSTKMINPIGAPNLIAPHMIPQQQFGNNIDMIKFVQQQQKMPLPQLPEVMKRPEVQSIVQDLTSGEISQYSLWQRLATPGLSPIERDIITNALNIFSANSNPSGNAGMFTKPIQQQIGSNMFPQMKASAPIPMPQGSPLSPVPPPLDQHMLFQQQAAAAANKLRLSPLPAAGFSMGPAVLPPNNTLTLHVPGIPQRIPSPRELQYHTQSIMQNALIRKKLEEQRENFRKRQEQEQKEQLQKQGGDRKNQEFNLDGSLTSPAQSPDEIPKIGLMESPIKKAPAQHHLQRQHASSPNIFTPTSVLRKMTAERDDNSKIGSDKKKAITGQSQQSRMPQQQQQFIGNFTQMDRIMQMQAQNEAFGKVNWDSQSSLKPQGRPIVKGAGPGNPPQSNPMMASSQQQSNMMSGNFELQQQQQMQKMSLQKQFLQQQQQIMQMKKQQQMDNPVLTQFMAQHQQRSQSQQQHMNRSQFPLQMTFQQQMMQGRKEQDEVESRSAVNNGGCLSPTSNQLAKWFSPELLADASAGKLPSMKMNGQMLSLEEFEKCIQNS